MNTRVMSSVRLCITHFLVGVDGPQLVVSEFKAAGFEADVVVESLPRQYIVVALPG